MTRVVGVAVDPETGDPVSKRLVYATLMPRSATGYFPPDSDDYDEETVTATDGTWELNLRPTVDTVTFYRIRVWLNATFIVDVPNSATPVDVYDVAIPPPDPGDPPVNPGPYVMRSELSIPNGVATLGPDGILKLAQRPPTEGTPEPAEWFSGDGPPPAVIPGAALGDIYVDRLTGDLYQLD